LSIESKNNFLKIIKLSAILFVAGFIFFGFNINSVSAAACQTATASVTWTTTAHWSTCSSGGPQTGDTVEIMSGHTVTQGANRTIAGLQINSGGTLDGSTFTMTITGTGSGVNGLTVDGAWTGSGAVALSGAEMTISGNSSAAHTGLITITNNKTINSQNFIRAGAVTISTGTTTNNGTIEVVGVLTISSGATWTQGTNSTLKVGATGAAIVATGTFTATASGNTVEYNRANTQTGLVTTFSNLTISGTGAKTFSTTPTVNGVLSFEGTGTIVVTTGVVTYGANATLQYDTPSALTATLEEWITPFLATGGVIIKNTGIITMGGAKQFGNNTNVPFIMENGSRLTPSTNTLTFHGNYINNGGTWTAAATPVTIAGTVGTQSIAGFTTTGLLTFSKTSGTATMTEDISGGAITMTGNGGTFDLGADKTHIFTGTLTRTNGTLQLNTSTVTFSGSTSGSTGVFDADSATAIFNRAGTQTVMPVTTYLNLTLDGTNAKTFATDPTINGVLSMEGTASVVVTAGTTGRIVYGANATLQYNKPAAYTATAEEMIVSPAVIPNLVITNTGAITVHNTTGVIIGTSLLIERDATLRLGNQAFTSSGTTILGAEVFIGGTGATLNVAGAGSTGTYTFTGDITVYPDGVFDLSVGTHVTSFGGNIEHSGTTFNTGASSTSTFTASRALSGVSNMTFGATTQTINSNIVITNNNTGIVTFSGALAGGNGSSSFVAGASSNTRFGGAPMSTGTLMPSASAHTIRYTYASPTCKTPTTNEYYNLEFTGSGTVTCNRNTIVNNATLSGTVSWTLAPSTNLTIGGVLTVGSGTTFVTGANLITLTSAGTPLVLGTTGTFTPTSNGTVLYTGNGATIKATTYHHLRLEPSGSSEQILGGGLFTINGNLTIGNATNAGATAESNAPGMIIAGTTTIATGATFTPGSYDPSTLTRTPKGTFTGAVVSNSVTFSNITIANGASIIVGGNNNGTSTPSSMTWNGSSLTQRWYLRNTDQSRSWVYSRHNVVGGTGNLVINFNAGVNNTVVWVSEYTKINSFDKTASATGNSTAPSSGATAETTQDDELLIGSVSYGSETATVNSWGNGFSTGQNGQYSGQGMGVAEGYKIVSTTGAYTAAATLSAGNQWSTGIATFRIKLGDGTITFNGNLTVNGTFSGSEDSSITTNGDVTGTGTINLTGGTFKQRVNAAQNFRSTSDTQNWTFNNLTFSNSNGSSRTITTPSDTETITVLGSLKIGELGDTAPTVLDAGNRLWTLSGVGGVGNNNYPTVEGRTNSQSTADATSHTVNFDDTPADGDLLIVAATFDGTPTITWPTAGAGWTQLSLASGGTAVTQEIRYRIADGDSSSITLSTGASSEEMQTRAWRISAGQYTGVPQVGTAATSAGSANPNPPSVTAASSDNNLFIAVYSSDASVTTSVYPTNYSVAQNSANSGGTGGVTTAAAARQLVGATDDPSAFTKSAAGAWVAQTIVVRGYTESNDVMSFNASSTLTGSTSTFKYTGNAATIACNGANYYDLQLYPASSGASNRQILCLGAGKTLSVSRDLTIGSGSGAGASGGTNNPTINVGRHLTIASGATFISTSGTLTVAGAFTKTGSFTHNEGIVILDNGASLVSSNLFTLNNLTTSGTVTATGSSGVTLTGNLNISSGAFTSTGSNLTIAGNFTDSGTFTHNSGTVIFNGGEPSEIDGNSTVFNNFTSTTAGKILKFKEGETVRFNGLLTLTGTSGDEVFLDSIDGSGQWTINHQGTESVDYVNVNHSTCFVGPPASTTITNTNSIDGGTNIGSCWGFSTGITFSGIVYQNNESDPYATSTAMKLAIGATTSYTTNSNVTTGDFQFTDITQPSNGDVITVWLNTGGAGSIQGSLVFKYGASCNGGTGNDCTGLSVVLDQVRINNKHTGNMVNSDLAVCDNDSGPTHCTDTDIGFTSEGGALTLTWPANELKVASGVTLAPGGNVNAQKLDIAGTYTGGTETLALSGAGTSTTCTNATQTPLCISGTFTPTSNTVAYTSTSASNIFPTTYHHLSMLPTSGSPVYTFSTGDTNVNGNLTIGDGANTVTVNLPASGTQSQTFIGDVLINNLGTLGGGSGSNTTNINGNFTGDGTLNLGSNVTWHRVTSSKNFGPTGDNNWGLGWIFYFENDGGSPVSINTSSGGTGTVNIATNLVIDSNLTLNMGDRTWDNFGWWVNNGSIDPQTSTVRYTGETGSVASMTFNNLTLGGTGTYTLPAFDVILRGNMLVNTGATITKSASNKLIFAKGGEGTQTLTGNAINSDLGIIQVSANAGNTTLSTSSNIKATSVIVDASQNLDIDSDTLTLTGSGTPFVINGNFNSQDSTVQFTGTSAVNLPNGPTNFNNISLIPAATVTYTAGDVQIPVYNNLIIGNGVNALTLDVVTNSTGGFRFHGPSGSMVVAPNAIISASDGIYFEFTGGSNTLADNTSSKQNLGTIRMEDYDSTPTLTLNSSIKAAVFALNKGTFNMGAHTMELTRGATGGPRPFPILAGTTFNADTGTVLYTGTEDTAIENAIYHNLEVKPGANGITHILGTATSQTLTVGGNLTLGNGTNTGVTIDANTNDPTLNVAGNLVINADTTFQASNSGTFTIGGNYTNSGTFADNSGTVTFNAEDVGKTLSGTLSGTSDFYKLVFNGSGGGWTLGANLETSGASGTALSVASGTLNNGGFSITGNGASDIFTVSNGAIFEMSGTSLYPASFTTYTYGLSSTVGYLQTDGTTITNATYGHLELKPAGATPLVLPATLNPIFGNLVIGNGTNAGATASANNPTINVAGNLSISSGAIFVSTSGNLTIGGNLTNDGVFTHSNGTVVFYPGSSAPYQFIRTITIDYTKVPSTVVDFPVLIQGTYPYLATTANGGRMRNANGYDLAFFADAELNTQLAHETEKYVASTGEVVYWVKVPSISHTQNTVIYMAQGNPSITTDQSDPENVWDSNFVMVQHLKQAGNGTADEYVDSTSNSNGGQGGAGDSAKTPSLTSSGKIDGAQTFDGDNDHITVGDSNSLDITDALTIGFWFKSSTTDNTVVLEKTNSNSNYHFQTTNEAMSGGGDKIFFGVSSSGSTGRVSSSVVVSDNTWHQVVGTFDTNINTLKIYIDGLLNKTNSSVTDNLTANTDNLLIGSRSGASPFPGSMDEIRISNSVRSADWIATEYNNQNSPSTFYTIGGEQIAGSLTSVVDGNNNITFNNFTVNPIDGAGKSLQFKDGRTYTFSGVFNISGESGYNLALSSTTPSSQWTTTFNSTALVNYISVIDSACSGGGSINLVSTIVNLGNNGICWIFRTFGGGSGIGGGAPEEPTEEPQGGGGDGSGDVGGGGGGGGGGEEPTEEPQGGGGDGGGGVGGGGSGDSGFLYIPNNLAYAGGAGIGTWNLFRFFFHFLLW